MSTFIAHPSISIVLDLAAPHSLPLKNQRPHFLPPPPSPPLAQESQPKPPSLQSMVSPHKRRPKKPTGPSRKSGGRVAVQIRKNIPYNEKEVVTRTQVTQKVKNRVVVKSTKVKIPIIPPTTSTLPDPSSSDQGDPQMSEMDTNPQSSDKQTRKGQSRSAAARPYSPHSTH